VRDYAPLRRAFGGYIAVDKGVFSFWQIACSIPAETAMTFMCSMIFPFALIAWERPQLKFAV